MGLATCGARQHCATHAATRTRYYGVVHEPVAGNIPPFVYWNEMLNSYLGGIL
jgi:hypothetical protein